MMKKILTFVSGLFLMLTLAGNAFATIGQATDDTLITTEVKAKLLEKKINPLEVHVETTDGVVMLTGHVKSEADKGLAAETAQAVKNVKSVNNQLVVKTQ
ncbi:MAG: BON domain-containing protein [Legionellales bacterium]|jgi:hyperosmotically inducible protein